MGQNSINQLSQGAPSNINMSGVSFPSVNGHALASGTTDIYTAPAGKRVALLYTRICNPSTNSSNVAKQIKIKVSGNYFNMDQNATVNIGSNSTPTDPAIILEPGESISVTTGASGLNMYTNAIQFDTTSPYKMGKVLGLSNGNNTIYTVPSGKTAQPVRGYFYNGSGGTRTLNVYIVPNASSPATGNILVTNFSALNGNVFTVFTNAENLGAGDSLVVNTDSGNAGQNFWFTMMEQ